MSQVIVTGAGASGMMAAYTAAMCGHHVLLLEKNEKCGKKLYITGKGRCNLTNAAPLGEVFSSIPRNAKFLYSSLYTFDNQAVMNFFETHGLPLKTERGNRVFPQSDHSSDVIRTLKRAALDQGVKLRLNTEVQKIHVRDGAVTGVTVCKKYQKEQTAPGSLDRKNGTEFLPCDALILACGGRSYPSTGSDGGGYALAGQCGHRITNPCPSLVPLNAKEDYVRELQGLSLKNVTVTLYMGQKQIYKGFGEMLFTHFGVSGPLILSASSLANEALREGPVRMEIDLKPALSREQLDLRLQRMFAENRNKAFKNSLSGLLPARLLPVMLRLSGVDPEKKVNAVTRQERLSFASLLKALPCTITGLRDFDEAIITRGGVDTRQISPSTLQSKLVSGLYFAGEMIDVDALTGGFNLQIAWSTGYLAGLNAGNETPE